jgi:hypothetical protein
MHLLFMFSTTLATDLLVKQLSPLKHLPYDLPSEYTRLLLEVASSLTPLKSISKLLKVPGDEICLTFILYRMSYEILQFFARHRKFLESPKLPNFLKTKFHLVIDHYESFGTFSTALLESYLRYPELDMIPNYFIAKSYGQVITFRSFRHNEDKAVKYLPFSMSPESLPVARYGLLRKISEYGIFALFSLQNDLLDEILHAIVYQDSLPNKNIYTVYLNNPNFLELIRLINHPPGRSPDRSLVMSDFSKSFFADYLNDCSAFILISLHKLVKSQSDEKVACFFWNAVKDLNFLKMSTEEFLKVFSALQSIKKYPGLMEILEPFSTFLDRLINGL